jgi:hypothetical protein
MKFPLLSRSSLLSAVLLLTVPILSGAKDWKDEVKDAALNYADQKKNELVQEASKRAILEIYKKVYPSLSTKSEKEAFRQLGELGINASRLNGLASDLASGDPAKVQSASESLAVDLGTKLSSFIKTDPYMRDQMKSLLGNADKITEVSRHLGSLAGGDPQPIYEYAGDLVIQAAGGAGIVGFYRTAHGAMKFAKDAYVDSEIEDLYQRYKAGRLDPIHLDLGGTHFAIRDKIMAEREQKLADIGRVDITPELRDYLTAVNEEEFKSRMLAGFEARKKNEERAKAEEAAAAIAKDQAEAMLAELDFIAAGRDGADWWEKRSVVLDKFLEFVRRKTAEEPGFDAGKTRDLEIMSRLFSTQLIYGKDSPEYKTALEKFGEIRDARLGIEPVQDLIPTGTLSGTWSGIYGKKYQVKVGGTFRISIAPDGGISGSFGGDDSGSLSGKVSSAGAVNVSSGGGQAGSGQWTGTISRTSRGVLTGNGSWKSGVSTGRWEGTGQ